MTRYRIGDVIVGADPRVCPPGRQRGCLLDGQTRGSAPTEDAAGRVGALLGAPAPKSNAVAVGTGAQGRGKQRPYTTRHRHIDAAMFIHRLGYWDSE